MEPEQRSVVKVKLRNILKRKKDIKVLEQLIRRMNVLCAHVYQFLRLWILTLDEVPNIDKNTFHMCFKVLTAVEKNGGPKPKGKNGKMYQIFKEFYDETYSKLNYERLDAANLSSVSSYAFVQMKTAFENNIKSHYLNHVRRFVNKSFKQGSLSSKEFHKQLYAIKNDLFNHTLESPVQYHRWIQRHRKVLVPAGHSLEKLYEDPQSYLKHMIYMSEKLERMGCKQFQFFPQRTSLIPKHITLDTKALIEMFSDQKGEDLKYVSKIKGIVWGKIFKTNNKAFRRRNHIFDHMITTNGYEASILFIDREHYAANEQRKAARAKASVNFRKLYEGKTEDEKDQMKQERKDTKKLEKKQQEKPVKRKRKHEFTYLEDATDEEQDELKTRNYGIIDMGKIRIITMLNNSNGKIFKHTRRDEIKQTKRLSIQSKIQRLRDPIISPLETSLSQYSNKTCNEDKYKEYVMVRNGLLLQLSEQYSNPRFRRFQFHLYINRTRTKYKLVEKMRSFLSDITPQNSSHSIRTNTEPILVFGNWSANKNMKHMISTPGIGLKRFLLKHFTSYDIDEFRTSILHHKTEQRCENLYLEGNKIHSVLTYKMDNNRLGCINRDRNAVLNMQKIVNHILEDGTYPPAFQR